MNWISVKERLPEGMQFVLVWCCLDEGYNFHPKAGFYSDGNWVVENKYVMVSHWQPLPEPPKEK